MVSIGAEGIEINLNFTEPLVVSSGDKPELLLLQLALSEYEDENG